jgi:hypothetical protein
LTLCAAKAEHVDRKSPALRFPSELRDKFNESLLPRDTGEQRSPDIK